VAKKKVQQSKSKEETQAPDYEKMGRQLESLYDTVRPDRGTFYRSAFLKGVLGGVGGVVGATLVVALLIWLLSLFSEVPLIGNFVETIRDTLQTGQ